MTQRTDWGAWNIKIMEIKIMDYEQKYKDNFELAKDWYNDATITQKEKVLLEAMYPELKESEDERIRKELIQLLSKMTDGIIENYTPIPLRDFIAYLERQKEQKPAEWGEEDEKHKQAILQDLANIQAAFPKVNIQPEFDWLKSLRPQPHWKPSEYTLSLVKKVANGEMLTHLEQMAMETICNDLQKLL